jgi:hypothetical protein
MRDVSTSLDMTNDPAVGSDQSNQLAPQREYHDEYLYS